MDVKVTGFASAEFKVWTVKDLRLLVEWCDQHKVGDECGVDYGEGCVYVELTGVYPADAEMVECGDHVPPSVEFDVLINTHTHGKPKTAMDYPANYEEALEDAIPVDVPKYDWVTRDRYNDPGRPE